MALYWAVVPLFPPAPGQSSPTSLSSPSTSHPGSPYDTSSSRDSSPAPININSTLTPASTESLDMELFKASTTSNFSPRRNDSPQRVDNPGPQSYYGWDQGSTGSRDSASPMMNTASLPTIQEESTSSLPYDPMSYSPTGSFFQV